MISATTRRQPAAVPTLHRLRYLLVLAVVLGGAILQHVMVTAPPEPLPIPPRVSAFTGVGGASAPRNVPADAPVSTRGASPPPPSRRENAHPAGRGPLQQRIVPRTTVKGARLLAPALASAGSTASDAALTEAIRRAFADFALPYQEDSALIVAVARQFGIDPAIPAALFMHEDGNINNRALFPDHMNWLLYYTHNPGNIKCMYDPCYEGFQVYPTYRDGILDWFRLYDHYYFDLGIHDLAAFVATYCPPDVDGNGPPAAYQSDVTAKAARIHAGW